MLKFNDLDTEKYMIASCLSGPESWRNFPSSWLYHEISKNAYAELKKFLEPPYSSFPSIDVIMDKVEDLDTKLFLKECSIIKSDPSSTNIRLYDLFEMYSARKVYDIAKSIPNDLEKTRVEEVVRAKITELAELVNPLEKGTRERGFIWESAKARWNRYRNIEDGKVLSPPLATGIEEFDRNTNGGLRATNILCFYAATNSYKTKTMANLGYNFAFQSKADVMVMTLETSRDDYEAIIDSRNTLLSLNNIAAGKLGFQRSTYRESLIKLQNEKPSFYIVDIPDLATSADIIAELELYYTKFGKYPDVLILDYLNEMEPVSKWHNTSEKFKNLGVEIRRITRSYKIRFVTAMQENREGMKLKDRSKSDLTNVGESQYFSNVCFFFVHLYQDKEGIDEATNQLHWAFKKNRAGKKDVAFSTFVSGEYNYVGDRRINIG